MFDQLSLRFRLHELDRDLAGLNFDEMRLGFGE